MLSFNSSRIEQQIFVYPKFGCFIHAQLYPDRDLERPCCDFVLGSASRLLIFPYPTI